MGTQHSKVFFNMFTKKNIVKYYCKYTKAKAWHRNEHSTLYKK